MVIEGFYDSMVPITDADREAISDLPEVEAHYRDDIGFAGEERVAGSHAEALLSPSFNVRGLRSAGVGGGARNVIPTEATASVDVRLAAGNDPVDMLALIRRHFEGQGFVVLDREPTAAERRAHRHLACMRVHVGYPAARVPMDLPEAETIVRATEVASGRQAVRVPTFGGSVPLHHFDEVLGTPALILPIANYDNNQHAADENLLLDNLWYGVALWSVILSDQR